MRSWRRGFLSIFVLFSLGVSGCEQKQIRGRSLYIDRAPQGQSFKNEIQYLKEAKRLTEEEISFIENQIERADEKLGVPKALLWCVLFQESRFDSFRNAFSPLPAKGIGQFTPSALTEINLNTNYYDPKTRAILNEIISPKTLPIDFELKTFGKPLAHSKGSRHFPEQSKASYFNTATAIFTSASYLNNRYQQLRKALDHQGIIYNSEVLWLYAAAAYNKGARSVFLLLTQEYMSHGESAVQNLLQSPKATYDILTHPERLDSSLKEVWNTKRRERYIQELLKNMEVLASCALAGQYP